MCNRHYFWPNRNTAVTDRQDKLFHQICVWGTRWWWWHTFFCFTCARIQTTQYWLSIATQMIALILCVKKNKNNNIKIAEWVQSHVGVYLQHFFFVSFIYSISCAMCAYSYSYHANTFFLRSDRNRKKCVYYKIKNVIVSLAHLWQFVLKTIRDACFECEIIFLVRGVRPHA